MISTAVIHSSIVEFRELPFPGLPRGIRARLRNRRCRCLDVGRKALNPRYNHRGLRAYPPISRLNSDPREGVGYWILG